MNNISNYLIPQNELQTLINTYLDDDITYKISNIRIYYLAFMHKSFLQNLYTINIDEDDDYDCFIQLNPQDFISDKNLSYEKLEFLGDAVLNLSTVEYLYNKFQSTKKQEGELTILKNKIVESSSLAVFSKILKLDKYLLLSAELENKNSRTNSRILEDIFESFIGAMFKDTNSDYKICNNFIKNFFNKHVDFNNLINNNTNYKHSLEQFYHANNYNFPVYLDIKDKLLPEGIHEFTVGCTIDISLIKNSGFLDYCYDRNNLLANHISSKYNVNINNFINNNNIYIIGIGSGEKKRTAQKNCAKNILDFLKYIKK